MVCIGCEKKKILTEVEVKQLIQEQLTLEQNLAEEKVKVARMRKCKSCIFRAQHTCIKCGCFYEFRASLADKKCPINSWNE